MLAADYFGAAVGALKIRALRQVYGAICTRFCKRRSLLLLNLKSQIRMEELLWVAAIDRHCSGKPFHARAGAADARGGGHPAAHIVPTHAHSQ